MSKGWHGHEKSGIPDLLPAKYGIRAGSFYSTDVENDAVKAGGGGGDNYHGERIFWCEKLSDEGLEDRYGTMYSSI